MFQVQYKVRMSDTDMAGIIFFAHQLRFTHYTLEEFFEKIGFSYHFLFHENPFVFVIVHAESDYFHPLNVGDQLIINLIIDKIGTTSITFKFEIYRDDLLVGKASIIQVCLDRLTRKKTPIPYIFKEKLIPYI